MEGLIPFVLDAIRKSSGRDSYRCVSSDGSSHGSRRNLIDYTELPADGAAWSEFVQPAMTDVRVAEEHAMHARPAAVVAGSAYRRK
jgi:hypothetical protein|nr:uncharacterized protein LOC127332836 [Lolium perenne]